MADAGGRKLITGTGVRNIVVLAVLGAAGWYVWKRWVAPKLAEDAASAEQAASQQADAAAAQSVQPPVRTLVDTSAAQKYAGTLASPIVLPIGPSAVMAGKVYATPSMFMINQRKVAAKKQPQIYFYVPIMSTRQATGVGAVRQFMATMNGTFTGYLLSEGGRLWAEIKTA